MTAGVLGVVVVLSGAVALAAVVTHGDSTTAQGAKSPGAAAPSGAPPSSAAPTAPTSTAPTSTTPTAAPVGTPTRRVTATPTPTPSRSTPRPELRPSAPVLVLNATTVQGLASDSAARVRNVGFAVTGVGNLRGRYGHTTICYRPGYADQAWLLAGRLRGMQDVVPAPAGVPGSALTLVVAEDFRN
jgi:hypothetical protein